MKTIAVFYIEYIKNCMNTELVNKKKRKVEEKLLIKKLYYKKNGSGHLKFFHIQTQQNHRFLHNKNKNEKQLKKIIKNNKSATIHKYVLLLTKMRIFYLQSI